MAEVAFASGFGSIRRFNETFQALFGRPPGALRRSSRADVSAGPRGEVSLLLRYQPPYDWDAMLGFLAARAIPGVEHVTPSRWSRTIDIDGQHGYRFGAARGRTRARGDDLLSEADRAAGRSSPVSAGCSIWPPIRAPSRHIWRRIRPSPRSSPRGRDCACPGAWDGFELAVRAVLGQQITVTAARSLAGKLVAALWCAARRARRRADARLPPRRKRSRRRT